MKICTVSGNLCMRASQTSLAARKVGHTAHVLVHLNPTRAESRVYNDHMDSISVFIKPEQLMATVRLLAPDIIHVHDRPHDLAAMLTDAGLGVPIVHDVHDLDTLLWAKQESPHEAKSLIQADGLVFVSDAVREYAESRYGPLAPSIVVHSTVLSDFFPQARGPHIGAAVWEGGLYCEEPNSPRQYIDQREIIDRFRAVGQSAIVYPAEDDAGVFTAYTAVGATVATGRPLDLLLAELSRYEFGWYGQTADHRQIHDTLPNKLFEYVAAGLPVLVINAREAGRFVEKHGIGIHVNSPEDIVRVKDWLMALRPQVWEKRWEFTREKSCEPLWVLYDKVLKSWREEAESQIPKPFILNKEEPCAVPSS